jgi:raffinose/stachyose/melibiose transport system permease protein
MMAASAVAPRRQTLQQRRWTIMPATYLIAIVLVGITLAPLLFVVVDGFRTNADINSSPIGVPHPWVLSNYTSILGTAPFWQFLGNSALVATVSTTMAVVLGSMAAFALSRYQFRFREGIFTLFISGLLFPLGVAALPLYLLLQHLGLLDNQLGLAVVEAAFALPVTMLILRPFMRAIPGELEDAALVDGAGKLRFFVQILVPLSRPALVTVALLAFVGSWNTYLLPLLIFTTPSHFTLPLGVATYQTQFSTNTAAILAFTAIAAIPALGIFMFAERYLVAGAAGAVKG